MKPEFDYSSYCAKDFLEGEQNDIRTKVESAADNQKEV